MYDKNFSDSETGEGEHEFYSPPESRETTERRNRINKSKLHGPKCLPRIEILAEPGRRHLLALYEAYKSKLPPDKVEKIKMHLQEIYAMTPEESEKYFAKQNERNRLKREKQKQRKHLVKLLKQQKQIKDIICAYKTFYEIMKRGMEFAVSNPSPPVVTVRLRNLSNIILEHLSDLRKIEVPQRNKPSKLGIFLIAVADWTAVFVEHLYYDFNVVQNREAAQIKEMELQNMMQKGPVKIIPSETVDIKQFGEESMSGNGAKTEAGGVVSTLAKDKTQKPDEADTNTPYDETDEDENY